MRVFLYNEVKIRKRKRRENGEMMMIMFYIPFFYLYKYTPNNRILVHICIYGGKKNIITSYYELRYRYTR